MDSKGTSGKPSADHYMMFRLVPIAPGESLYGGVYDITRLVGYHSGHGSALPFDTAFADLLRHGVVSVK